MYRARVVDAELAARLEATGAVVIEGPRACGKTATARQAAASEVLLDTDENAQRAVLVDPGLVLGGPTPRLLDEWQTQPTIWNHVRRAVDDRGRPGQFILTGSAVPADDLTRHTGAMRITRLRMRPMSLHESGHGNGAVSLAAVLRSEPVRSQDPGLTARDIVDRIVTGGWPGLASLTVGQAAENVRGYVDEIARTDISRVDGVRRDPTKVRRLLASLARNVATTTAVATLAADTGGDGDPVKQDTIHEYLAALERLMVIEDQPAWAPRLRSKSVLRSSPKRHFVDPSLAVAALAASPATLLADLNLVGFLFESLVARDLRVHAQANDATVSHYRDSTGLEVDAIVQTRGGTWAAFEVKLGTGSIDAAVSTLQRFAARVDTDATETPAALAVIVGTGVAYTRADGVSVIPVGTIGP